MNGDERMLAQALTNLIKNAAEAIEGACAPGETPTGAIAIEITRRLEEIEVVIRDTGPGFPIEDRDRLLEPYVTTRKSGIGLGLAIVARIIEDHGGRMWLGDNDQAAKGARVDIRLPIDPPGTDLHDASTIEGVA